jgi:hypothetical protein
LEIRRRIGTTAAERHIRVAEHLGNLDGSRRVLGHVVEIAAERTQLLPPCVGFRVFIVVFEGDAAAMTQ